MDLLKSIPSSARKYIYLGFASAGVVDGVLHIAVGNPHWLDVATQIVAYLGVALGVTAHVNTTTDE